MAVPNFGQEAFFVQALKDTVYGYFSYTTLLCYILESGKNHLILIVNTQQVKENFQGFGVR